MRKLTIVVAVGFFLFILWILYMANTNQHTVFFDIVRSVPYGDKVGHFMLFGLLTLATNLASKLKVLNIYKFSIYWGTALVITFVVIEELSQYFIPTRTLDVVDFIANVAGIVTFTALSHILYKSI